MRNLLLTISIASFSLSLFAQNIVEYNTNELGYKTASIPGKLEFANYKSEKSTNWSDPLKISDYANEDSRDMGIAVGPDSTIHIVYCDDVPGLPSVSNQRISYKSKSLNGEWTEALIIDEFDGVPARNNHEASISVSNNGDIHVVYHYWAYDGTFLNQIGYSKYNKQMDTWSTELISGEAGTVESTYSNYPRITSTENNIPIAVWGCDNTNGTNETYLAYNNGTWQDPILVSSSEANKSQFPTAVSIGGEKIFLLFREYDLTQSTLAMYYRIFDATDGSLTDIIKIQESERPSTSSYDAYYAYDACYTTNNEVFILLNSTDTLSCYTYNTVSEELTKNPEEVKSNYSSYTNYNLQSICADNLGNIHVAYTVWNTSSNSIKYLSYNESDGFSSPETISAEYCMDPPQIVFGIDEELHIVYSDDSEDTNSDGYVDREIYYISTNVSNEIFTVENTDIHIYPNPSNGIFHINITEPSTIAISSINGTLVYTSHNTNDSTIDISDFSNGLYILNIKNKSGNFYTKIIKH